MTAQRQLQNCQPPNFRYNSKLRQINGVAKIIKTTSAGRIVALLRIHPAMQTW